MNVATLLRYMDMRKGDEYYWNYRYYILHDYKILAEKYKVGMYAIMSEYGLDEICNACDGLFVPGSGANINPKYWGGEDDPTNDHGDEFALDYKVIKKFYEAGKPIFGVCGGFQGLNVFMGGSIKLIPDLPNHYDTVSATHPINVERDSFVWDVFGKERVVTNSHHSYCIDKLAPDLRSVATADDGVIEAIENKERTVFATEWHPEQTLHGRGDPIEHKFFENFLKRCEEVRFNKR